MAQEPEKYVVTMRLPTMMRGVWHHMGAHSHQSQAEEDLAEIIASDVKDGAPVGSEWRITRERGYEQLAVVKLVRMTADGPAVSA